jgi:hypothetical protein
MKYFSIKKTGILLLAGLILAITSCVKKNFDTPPVIVPYVDFESNYTIKALKNKFGSSLTLLTDTIIIQGIVTANDESGNIFKSIYMQDTTGGIQINLDAYNLYTEYKVGQRLYIKCEGLYIGNYNGVIQLGYIYINSIGRMPAALIPSHLYKDSLPGPPPVPVQLARNGNPTDQVSMLVKIDSVNFPDFGLPFVDPTELNTNRDIADSTGSIILIPPSTGANFILRTSSYASFATTPLPGGNGTLTGILSVYNSQYQLYVRDMNDLQHFNSNLVPIYVQNFGSQPTDWTTYSVKSNKNWIWDETYFCMVANGYQGDVPSDDWLVSPSLNLAGVTNPVLSFKTWTQFTDNDQPNPLEVFISTDYPGSGDPTSYFTTKLSPVLSPAGSKVWTSSGNIDLSAYDRPVYIGFHYRSSGTGASTSTKWEMTGFKLTGEK